MKSRIITSRYEGILGRKYDPMDCLKDRYEIDVDKKLGKGEDEK